MRNQLPQALQDWLASHHSQAVISVKKLAGMTACSHLIQLSSGECYVWREQNFRAEQLGVNYANEAQMLSYLAHFEHCPKVLHQTSQGILLSWCEGQNPVQFSGTLLKQLADILAKLHGKPLSPNLPTLNLVTRCEWLRQQLPREQQAHFLQKLPEIEPLAQAICHHDLHLGNFILRHNQLTLIDWEYAAVSDPALEIALFFHYNPLSENEVSNFLQRYLSQMPFAETAFQAKMHAYRPHIQQLDRLWAALSEHHAVVK